jgi:hypothetical protein
MPTLDLPFAFPVTATEFQRLAPIEGLRVELWDGNLDVSTSIHTFWHGNVKFSLVRLFGHGRACWGVGLVLSDRTVREPM